MPISNELANICILVASVATNKQVVAFKTTAEQEALPKEEQDPADLEKESQQPADLEAGSGSGSQEKAEDEGPELTPEQLEMVGHAEKLGLDVVLDFDAKTDDPSGTAAACMEAFKTYCSNHLKLGDSCLGPHMRPSPAAFSKCLKDDDCHVFSKSDTGSNAGYKMSCHPEEKVCKPSYTNLRELKFMASGPNNGAPQTCEEISQGSAKKYFEVGDFNKKNRGHPATAKKNRKQLIRKKNANGVGRAGAMAIRVKSRSNYCADYHTGNNDFYVHPCHGASNQNFYFEKSPINGARIMSARGKCLDYHTGNGNLYFHTCHGGSNQLFYFEPYRWSGGVPKSRGSAARIKSRYSNSKCIDYGGGTLYMHNCHGGDNQKFYFQPTEVHQDSFVAAKLCGQVSNEPPDPPICDIVQAGGESAAVVKKAMAGTGAAAFGFTPIPTFFGGELEGGDPTYNEMYLNGHGMMFTQWGMDGRGRADCGGECDQCLHTRLFMTTVGCNVPQMPKGKEMECVKFVKTKYSNTPYGPIDEKVDVKCNETVPDTYSGWCECVTAEEGTKVVHAVRSAVKNPIGRKYTCEQECKKPTWVPAITMVEMAYSSADFSKGGPDGNWDKVVARGKGAKCKAGFYDVEHMPVGSVGSSCVNLNSELRLSRSNGVKPPPASKLCVKR
jgi:hypothetical protein